MPKGLKLKFLIPTFAEITGGNWQGDLFAPHPEASMYNFSVLDCQNMQYFLFSIDLNSISNQYMQYFN